MPRFKSPAIASLLAVATALWAFPARGQSLPRTIREAQRKMVKIYGAGGIRGLEAYQSGFLISADGHILTAYSYVLDANTVAVTLDDGRKFDAALLGADPRLEVAVLKIDATDLPHFDFKAAATGELGTRVLAFSNLFGVATGNEPVSVLHGTISAVSSLDARRGAFESPYQGPVYILDAMTNNPGAVGGALTDYRGQLLGMLGKELRNNRNNTWLNYAVPVHELVETVEAISTGQSRVNREPRSKQRPEQPLRFADLGIVLVPNVTDRTPPFVDEIRVNSPASRADIKPDDLIVLLNGDLVQSCNALLNELRHLERDAEIHLTVLRGKEFREVTLQASSKD
ncbi:MAG: serine protease [Pirellulales bacterium]|nr:serine protease [Pirellulales bacterium]